MIASGRCPERQMQSVNVTVITYAPTIFRHCQHCEVAFQGAGLGEGIHREAAKDALPRDLLDEFQGVSDWVHDLLDRHAGRVSVSVVDAASVEGVWKSLRHGVRTYPAVIVDGRETRVGSEFRAADTIIDQRLRGKEGSLR
jgi:hypothetical protein